eukprot:364764-Chlamydomonas_euryale.AAC.11
MPGVPRGIPDACSRTGVPAMPARTGPDAGARQGVPLGARDARLAPRLKLGTGRLVREPTRSVSSVATLACAGGCANAIAGAGDEEADPRLKLGTGRLVREPTRSVSSAATLACAGRCANATAGAGDEEADPRLKLGTGRLVIEPTRSVSSAVTLACAGSCAAGAATTAAAAAAATAAAPGVAAGVEDVSLIEPETCRLAGLDMRPGGPIRLGRTGAAPCAGAPPAGEPSCSAGDACTERPGSSSLGVDTDPPSLTRGLSGESTPRPAWLAKGLRATPGVEADGALPARMPDDAADGPDRAGDGPGHAWDWLLGAGAPRAAPGALLEYVPCSYF